MPKLPEVYDKHTAGGHQGLLIAADGSGRTVALTYDPADAAELARRSNTHPKLLAALRNLTDLFVPDQGDDTPEDLRTYKLTGFVADALADAFHALAEAEPEATTHG